MAVRSNVLNLYKSLTKELSKDKPLLDLIRAEFRQNQATTSKYCREPNEQYFIASAYLTYLKNTKENIVLRAKYAKGERSIEEAANIVGLRLPKPYQEESK